MDISISKGTFLISNPYVTDPNFYQTVVLICEYNERGSFGVILNRPLELTADDIVPESIDILGSCEKIYFGGPVNTNKIFCLHGTLEKSEEHQCEKVCENVYFGATRKCFNHLTDTGRTADSFRRIYMGCACWIAGQLESELEMNLWTIGPANDKLVFYPDADKIWWNVSHFVDGTDLTNPILN